MGAIVLKALELIANTGIGATLWKLRIGSRLRRTYMRIAVEDRRPRAATENMDVHEMEVGRGPTSEANCSHLMSRMRMMPF
jgi:hypothetical protein